MWFHKKAPEVVCVGCGCLMRKARKKVESWDYGIGRTLSYCGLCAPPYDVKRTVEGYDNSSTTFVIEPASTSTVVIKSRYYRKEPAQNIEITEKGKPIT